MGMCLVKINTLLFAFILCLSTIACQHNNLVTPATLQTLSHTAIVVMSHDASLRIPDKQLENRLLILLGSNNPVNASNTLQVTLNIQSMTTDIRGGKVTDRYRFTLNANFTLLEQGKIVLQDSVSNTGNYEADLQYYRDSQAKQTAITDAIDGLAQAIYYRLLSYYRQQELSTSITPTTPTTTKSISTSTVLPN